MRSASLFRGSVRLGGSADGALVGELGEDDEAHVGGGVVGGCAEFEGDGAFAEVLNLSYALEGADDADVIEMAAAVFAGFDLGRGGGVDEDGVEIAAWKL